MKTKFTNWCQKNHVLVAALAYVLITLIFTFPLVLRMNAQIPEGRGDVFQAVSNIDSRVTALGATVGVGHKLVFLAKNINPYLPYVFLNQIANKNLAYNLYFLFSFIASGIGIYLLAMYFVKNKWAAFLAGIVFAFAPFHFYQATVVNLGTMHQEWLPFFALFLFRFFEKFEFKYFAATGIFSFLIAMTEHQFLAFTVLFAALFLLFKIAEDKSILQNKKLWSYVAVFLALLVVAAFTLFGQMLKVATSDNNFLDQGMNAANKYSMSFLEPFVPAPFHSLWPGVNGIFQNIFSLDGRGSYFVGYSVLAVIVFLFWNFLKGKNFKKDIQANWRKFRDLYFWTIATVVFYFFSLGPSFSIGKATIYLPYFLIYKFLPFYENIRTTGRMFVFVLLGVSMLFAYGYVYLLKRFENKKLLATAVVTLVILLEFWVAPVKTMAISYSPFYDKIAKDGGQYKLIEIPGSTDYAFASYALFTQNIHGKTDLNGMPLARKISKEFQMQQETPVIKQLLFTIPKGNDPEQKNYADILENFDFNRANEILSYYNVRYITISKTFAKQGVIQTEEKFIQNHIAFTNRYEDKYLIAYEVKQIQPSGFYTVLDGTGFSDSFQENGSLLRVMGDGAGAKVVNMSGTAQNVKVLITAQNSNNPLKLTINADQGQSKTLTNSLVQYAFNLTLKPGENVLKFSVLDQAGKGVAVSNSKKKGRSGIMVSDIQIINQ